MSDYDQSEIQLFKDNINKFIDKEIEPYYEQWEKDGMIPREEYQIRNCEGSTIGSAGPRSKVASRSSHCITRCVARMVLLTE